MKEKRQRGWTSWLPVLVSAVWTIGMLTFLKPCAPGEDGMWMHCPDAGQTLLAIAAVILVLGLVRLGIRSHAGQNIVAAVQLVLAIVSLVIPGHLISLCMMPEMRCRAVMKPGAAVFAVIVMVCTVADRVAAARKER